METHKDQLEHYSNEMWCHLIDNIDIKYYPYNYSKMKPPPENPQHPYKKLMDQKVICNNNIYCRLFVTKCMHKHLVTKEMLNAGTYLGDYPTMVRSATLNYIDNNNI